MKTAAILCASLFLAACGETPQDSLGSRADKPPVAGTGVALHAKPLVAAQCTVRVNHGDLTALLYLQGYSRPEFAA